MDGYEHEDFGHRARQLRLDTLIRLRWIAAGGQATAMLIAHFALGVRFPLMAGFGCLGASVLLNLWLRWAFPVSFRLEDRFATRILGFDILQLAALLFLTGGLANPFSILFLAPVATAAVSLPWRWTLAVLALALVSATFLEFWNMPLRSAEGAPILPPPLYGVGLWAAICVSVIFVSVYGSRVAGEARQLASALNATELMLARAQHLSQLDGLAAAAAHELGTPLATVALVVHELAAQPHIAAFCAEDLKLAEEQVARCRTILGKLSAPSEMATASVDEVSIGHLIEEIAAPHRLQDVQIQVELDGEGPEPVFRRSPAVIYGVTNIVENAVGFAASLVVIRASWSPSGVQIEISDDGPGFSLQVLAQLGEPYISDRASARRSDGEGAGGLGLGLFIAKALLERSGGRLEIANAAPIGRGAKVLLSWPLSALEKGLRPARVLKMRG